MLPPCSIRGCRVGKIHLEVFGEIMIRMGRSSAKEQTNDTQNYQEPQTNSSFYQYSGETQPPPQQPIRAVSDSESMARDIKEGRLSGYVGNGTVLTGETSFQAMLRIDGHLTGRVTSESGTLIVGSTGKVDANIAVAAAIVSGTINGDIVATEKLELGRTARVVGNIQTPRLVIEDGAIFEGGCTMLKAKESLDKRNAKSEYPSYQTSSVSEETSASSVTDDEDEEEAEAIAN
jgi:cytoskeletal protein CcmA (bactofilin family)